MLERASRLFKAVVCSPITTRVVLPILAALPAAIFAASDLKNPWPKIVWDSVREFNALHPGFRTWAVFLPAGLIPLIFWFERLRESYERRDKLVEQELTLLLRILEGPVGRKRKSFGELARRHLNDGQSLQITDLFSSADPMEQITSLVEGIYHAFQWDVKMPDDLKVTLARMEKNVIQGYDCYLPRKAGPRSFTELQTRECTFNYAARERSMTIISDIKAESEKPKKNRRYANFKPDNKSTGCLICYPVIHHELDTVIYVIGLKYSKPNHFTSASWRRYEFILSQFAERICLEYSLKKLSEKKQP